MQGISRYAGFFRVSERPEADIASISILPIYLAANDLLIIVACDNAELAKLRGCGIA